MLLFNLKAKSRAKLRERERERERESCHFSKLDLPLFIGLLLSILHQNKARWVGGGIFFHHKCTASVNIASNIVTMDLVLCFAS
jgi:hypothetical protein